jgi:hypothetical protein
VGDTLEKSSTLPRMSAQRTRMSARAKAGLRMPKRGRTRERLRQAAGRRGRGWPLLPEVCLPHKVQGYAHQHEKHSPHGEEQPVGRGERGLLERRVPLPQPLRGEERAEETDGKGYSDRNRKFHRRHLPPSFQASDMLWEDCTTKARLLNPSGGGESRQHFW